MGIEDKLKATEEAQVILESKITDTRELVSSMERAWIENNAIISALKQLTEGE